MEALESGTAIAMQHYESTVEALPHMFGIIVLSCFAKIISPKLNFEPRFLRILDEF
jgi:hypothetical protein